MAKKTKAAYDSWVDSFINTNGVQGITGALMNTALIDLSDSIFFGERREGKGEVIAAVGTVIVFATPMTTDQYVVLVRPYDSLGDFIEWKVDPTLMTANGFTIVPAADGLLDYHAVSF